MGLFSKLFSKQACTLCNNEVGFFNRKKLVNNEGYICKECEKKTSALINVSKFTKEEIIEHIKYMEEQDKIYKEAFLTLDKGKKERYMCVETGIEFADEIAMFKYHSPICDKKRDYQELFRYDQIKSYEPYFVENTNNQGQKKYSEVGVKIILNCSWEPDMKKYAGNRSFHPYVQELKVPRHKNVDSFTSDTLITYLDKLFGKYEDNSVIGSIKSKIVGTNKEREQLKVASEGLKALGNLAKSKITGKETDQETMETFKNDAEDLLTGNRASYTKVANKVEEKILKK